MKKLNIVELLVSIAIFVNTLVLLLMRNTISYESTDVFEPVSKSSVITIMQHNPVIGYVYLTCGAILICSGIYRLHGFLRNTKDNR